MIDKVIYFPTDKYFKTAAHIEHTINKGKAAICTINSEGAEENRSQSLKGLPTKQGYDRDEFSMTFCDEGGTGAEIEYAKPADNRSAGSWISYQVDQLQSGTKVLIQMK
ncbi:NucA/NucB deoxyribonuclease domain-containing protein [Priestia megaterium]|uniref:NucA/NucB deoxyribonuclease domain-containing protein n=1 Tax=Priestia megaterium TaxID=1404 RepID=UPI001EE0EC84|nr:NucA/NucB deoxyribonuclease domain-containing protein [Priestia megaterium]MDH3174602.1 NucA/NucB deoxyribonuclease domain-containing protein [Priestia megaterium]